MTRLDFDPDLKRLGEALRASTTIDLAREVHAARPSGAGRGRHADAAPATEPGACRPRVFAGGTLGLAGVGAALVLALSAGGAAAPPALAVTHEQDGSVLVTVNFDVKGPWVLAADQKLAAMGIDEQIGIEAALEPGVGNRQWPGHCTALSGAATPAGPPVRVLLGTDGTQAIPAGNTGAGVVHLSGCVYFKSVSHSGSGNSGNTDNPGTG